MSLFQLRLVLSYTLLAAMCGVLTAQDWPQWGGSSLRNNAPNGKNIPTEWNPGDFDRKTGKWINDEAKNIKWVARLGSQTYGNPVVADGRIYVGTNNAAGYLKRYPNNVDLGCLLCFRESDGKFLWQYSSEKLPTGRVHDWPLQGIVSAPLVEGKRLWFVNNRGEVVCADTQGFYDCEDDGPEQRVRARLFTAVPKLTKDTKWNYYHPRGRLLRAIAEHGGLKLPSYPRVIRDPDGTQIIVGGSYKSPRRIARIDFADDEFRISRIITQSGKEAFEEVISVGTDLLAGIDKGKLSTTLRFLLAGAGTELPEQVEVRSVKPRQIWSIRTSVAGVPQEFELAIEGKNLVAYKLIATTDKHEADVVWKFDMMNELGVRQHNMATCCVTSWKDTLFVCTSNGVDQSHANIPVPEAPSFIAMDKHTGRVLWTDNSPGKNILHGQWSAPAVGEFDGVPQVIFCGGDGWVRSFRADRWKDGKPELLWKFDANPKASKWILGGRGTRNNLCAIPVIYDGLVYVVMGQDPEHGEGDGHLWCIDPTLRGDVSPELVIDPEGNPLPHFRLQATAEWGQIFTISGPSELWKGLDDHVIAPELQSRFRQAGFDLPDDVLIEKAKQQGRRWRFLTAKVRGVKKRFRLRATIRGSGDLVIYNLIVELETNARAVANPNSAVVWHYDRFDHNGDGKFDFEEEFHRGLGSVAIKNDLLFVSDFSGLVHCVDAKTGKPHWTYDLLAASWGSPLIVEDKVYIGDEDGDITIFGLSADPAKSFKKEKGTAIDRDTSVYHKPLHEMNMLNSVYSTPVVANNVLYISNRRHLFAITPDAPEDETGEERR
jgi:outer membrane protein assembly factor BamB